MVHATSVLEVEDYDHWKRVWDESATVQEAGGIRGYQVHHHPTDAQRIVVIREFGDLDQGPQLPQQRCPEAAHAGSACRHP